MKKKLLIALFAITAAVCGAFGFAACGDKTENSGNAGNTEQGGNQGGNHTDGNNNEDKLSKYSQILQNVLTDSSYDGAIDNCTSSIGIIHYEPELYAAPYNFLEKQGHDIDSVKNGDLECKTSVYTKDNDTSKLYISVRVENKNGSKNYYTNYVLKYGLTKQEYNDLYMLYENNYVQAPLFIQELSKQKTATVESKVNITTSGYQKIVDRYHNYDVLSSDVFGTKDLEFDIVYANQEENALNLAIRTAPGYKNMIVNNAQIRNHYLIVAPLTNLKEENSIFNLNTIATTSSNLDEYKTTYTPITYFNLAKATATNVLTI